VSSDDRLRQKLRKNRKQPPPAGETACPTIAAQAFAKKKVGQAVSPAYFFAASELDFVQLGSIAEGFSEAFKK
jgi:hypothetical protein